LRRFIVNLRDTVVFLFDLPETPATRTVATPAKTKESVKALIEAKLRSGAVAVASPQDDLFAALAVDEEDDDEEDVNKEDDDEEDAAAADDEEECETQGTLRKRHQFQSRNSLVKKNNDRDEAYITDSRMVATIVRLFLIAYPRGTCVFEPCEGTGAITDALTAAGFIVVSRDKFPRTGRCQEAYDVYTSPLPVTDPPIEVVFTNPPFDNKDAMMANIESYDIAWGMILPMDIIFNKFMEKRMASGRLQVYCLSKRPFLHVSNDPSVPPRQVMIGNVGLFMMDFPTFNFGSVVNIGYEWAQEEVKLAVFNVAATMENMSL
jgi:hypothetical protein